LPVARFLRLAFVGFALSLGDTELDLRATALVEIDRQRHDGDAIALDRTEETVDLAAMEQQSARPSRSVLEAR
jgi:hypothetical protein